MSALSAFTVAWALLALGVTLTVLLKARRRPNSAYVARRGVFLLRPIDSPSAQELENLNAPLPPGVRQVVLCPFRLRVAEGVEWLPSDPPSGNRKLGHVKYALDVLGPRETVVVIDGDVRVDEALLASLLGALDAGADAAWAAPQPQRAGLERGVLVQSLHSFDALAAISPAPMTMCGKAVALGPKAVEVLRALPDCVGEDLELASQLHQRGLTVELAGRALLPGSAGAPLQRFTRWMQVLRAHRPFLFPAVPIFFACTPVLLGASAWTLEPVVVAVTAAVLIARTFVAWRAERAAASTLAPVWWLGAEGLLLVAWVGALVRGRTVIWRGRRLQLTPGGALAARS
ncbi:MAG: glycosyltransferase [Archangium sp.]